MASPEPMKLQVEVSPSPINPILALFRSRKFLLLLFDTTISILAYYNAVDPVIIGILQPVVIAVIWGIATEDAAEKSQASPIAAGGDITVTNTQSPDAP